MWDANQAHSLFLQSLEKCNNPRRLRLISSTLFYDIAAVLSGLRPSFLLDYCASITAQELASLVATALEFFPQATTTLSSICVLQIEADCCLVSNLSSLTNLHPPLFIEFSPQGHGGVVAPRWATKEEQGTLERALSTFLAEVSSSFSSISQKKSHHHIPIIQVSNIFGNSCNSTDDEMRLLMPTANGCLLGYPVVYALHDMDGAQAASRSLSTTTLKLYSVSSSLLGSSEGRKEPQMNESLLSFSVPAELARDEVWLQRRQLEWMRGLRQRHAAAVETLGLPWGKISISESSCMRGIAL